MGAVGQEADLAVLHEKVAPNYGIPSIAPGRSAHEYRSADGGTFRRTLDGPALVDPMRALTARAPEDEAAGLSVDRKQDGFAHAFSLPQGTTACRNVN